jgi:predicted amidohydrolase
VGYPERFRPHPSDREELFNSLIVVNGDGENVAHYRKSSLYYTDETWASEGSGFYGGYINGLGSVAMGICMDINPYKFTAPWAAFEFGFHVLEVRANLVLVSMAWNTLEDQRTFTNAPEEPDMDTLTYWVRRMEPIIRAEQEDEIIVIFANRCGVEGEATYAGTSAVIGIQNGVVCVYGLLGRGVQEVLVVDTDGPPFAKLADRPEGLGESEEEVSLDEPMSDSPATSEKDDEDSGPDDAVWIDGRKYVPAETPNTPRFPSPRTSRTKLPSKGPHTTLGLDSPRQVPTYPRQASPREGYSPRFTVSAGDYSPTTTESSGAGYPSSSRHHQSPQKPLFSDRYAGQENYPDTFASGRAPGHGEEAPDVTSSVFPEPTPQFSRPKLAISTGPETLPPITKKSVPRGVQASNLFTSRDLCTPPETPFDNEPMTAVQQRYLAPSSFRYTPEEPEPVPEQQPRRATPAIPASRHDISRPPSRTVPTRPSSRTQEVKLSDLTGARREARSITPSIPPNHSKTGEADRRYTSGTSDRAPKLRSRRSKPSFHASTLVTQDAANRMQKNTLLLPKDPVQGIRNSDPFSSITIAASPSVFQTTFDRDETFPRQPPQSARGWESNHSRPDESRRRRKSISELRVEPVHDLPILQPTIFSAIEPKMSTDRMWAAATAALPPRRPRTAFSTRDRVARPVAEQLKPASHAPGPI